ncbi:MAG: hypothetical protein E7241_00535 [Lachnospiraceae bacterium]|nr:hypothetical protein [Lachnospiraceae bacterium]
MFGIRILNVEIYYILSWFFVYSFLGWAFESVYVSILEGHLVNRGFITGPFCTIYGCGGVAIYMILKDFQDNLFYLYVLGLAVATLIEYITAVIMEGMFRTRWWDYSDQKFNFQGRICLSSSLVWGFFAILIVRVIQPIVMYIVNLYPVHEGTIGLTIVIIIFAIDFTFSAIGAARLAGRLDRMHDAMSDLYASAMDTRIGSGISTIKDKVNAVVSYSLNETPLSTVKSGIGTVKGGLGTVKGGIDSGLEKLSEMIAGAEFGDKTEAAKQKIKDTYVKYINMIKQSDFIQDRFIDAYPHMKSMVKDRQEQLGRIKESINSRRKKKK